jgi:hypothetical protein
MIVAGHNGRAGGDRLIAQEGRDVTDQEWIRLELKNAEARRHIGGGLAAGIARVLRRLRQRPSSSS